MSFKKEKGPVGHILVKRLNGQISLFSERLFAFEVGMCCLKFIRVLPGAYVVRYCALSNVSLYYFEQTDDVVVCRSLITNLKI